MNGQGLAVERRSYERARLCSVQGCGRVAKWDGEMCEDCAEMSRDLDFYWSEEQQKLRKERAARLADLAWGMLVVAMMSAVGYYVWPFVWATFELWFRSGQ
jgi:hypothetical protein